MCFANGVFYCSMLFIPGWFQLGCADCLDSLDTTVPSIMLDAMTWLDLWCRNRGTGTKIVCYHHQNLQLTWQDTPLSFLPIAQPGRVEKRPWFSELPSPSLDEGECQQSSLQTWCALDLCNITGIGVSSRKLRLVLCTLNLVGHIPETVNRLLR